MDTIGDFLTIIRNASSVGKSVCLAAASNIRISLADVLRRNGYIADYEVKEVRPGVREISLYLKYVKGISAFTEIVRCSRPGCRLYYANNLIPKVRNNLGLCILTTSKGILSTKEAVQNHVGGELLCKIW